MNCKEFLERYSEFRDRDEVGSEVSALESHLEGCESCRRYHQVVERGVDLVRSFDGPRPRADFEDRIRHRIYYAELMDHPHRRDGSSPLVALALAAAAVIASVGAWSSISDPGVPTARLPGITAATPTSGVIPEPIPLQPRSASATRSPAFLTGTDLWSQSSELLYEHSTLYHRYRQGTFVRTGLH